MSTRGFVGEQLLEALAEILTDVVVDDGVHAGICVGEAVTQHAEYLVDLLLRLVPEIDDEEVRVQREPAETEHQTHGHQDLGDVGLPLGARRARGVAPGAGP